MGARSGNVGPALLVLEGLLRTQQPPAPLPGKLLKVSSGCAMPCAVQDVLLRVDDKLSCRNPFEYSQAMLQSALTEACMHVATLC